MVKGSIELKTQRHANELPGMMNRGESFGTFGPQHNAAAGAVTDRRMIHASQNQQREMTAAHNRRIASQLSSSNDAIMKPKQPEPVPLNFNVPNFNDDLAFAEPDYVAEHRNEFEMFLI